MKRITWEETEGVVGKVEGGRGRLGYVGQSLGEGKVGRGGVLYGGRLAVFLLAVTKRRRRRRDKGTT